ncbi:Lrp/AsnC family transcriptional regulator [Parasphingorhabdus halotolerans]|uniref:Lrp/AsnC family transcriptional regulator n=1 Tax=Parasphingorhabdus halotolerans TaxID=2725558 RepID=UPI001B39D594|nr:winged helix-turn-helix transcriptional regulator [Parasphingorhabdus halotolerans]
MDRHDWRILEAMQDNGRLPLSELSERVGLTKTPCQIRLKKLEEEGYITGYHARLNMSKIKKTMWFSSRSSLRQRAAVILSNLTPQSKKWIPYNPAI